MEKITAKTGRIAFIGAGMMAEAILKGMLHADIAEPALITVSDPSAARREYLEETYKVNTVSDNYQRSCRCHSANGDGAFHYGQRKP